MNAADTREFKKPNPARAGQESRQGPQVYLLHFSRPYKHARHYTGKAESSGFLKVPRRLFGGGFSELAFRCAGHLAGRGTYPAGRVRR
jgi:hypothetical protein